MKTRFWCYSIHGSVNDDPVQLLFCGDLTILLLGLIIYCLFKLKRKLRHSLRRPSRSDLVQSEFMEVFRMKQKVPMICNIVSLILLIVFVIKSIVDYTQYSTSLNSAPFYLWVLVNALFLVIPAIILFVIGFVVKKKQ